MPKFVSTLIILCVTALCFDATPAKAQLFRLRQSRFIDNGDGTVTDTTTSLMWAKPTGSTTGAADPNDVLNVNNTYTWCEGTSTACGDSANPPNGSAFTFFLGALNRSVTNFQGENPGAISGCFAKHCDWRLPTVAELFAIVDKSVPGCSNGAANCISPALGPSQPHAYWAATTLAADSSSAFVVDFGDGTADDRTKGNQNFVRAVRGISTLPGLGALLPLPIIPRG